MGTFTRIDIAVKNPPIKSFSLRKNSIYIRLEETFDLSSIITCNHIGLNDINIGFDNSKIAINGDWAVSSSSEGEYDVNFSFEDIHQTLKIIFKKSIPEFELTKTSATIYKDNSVNLRDYINLESCKDVDLDSIEIAPKIKTTILKGDLFDKNNSIGQHIIFYSFGEYQRTLEINVKEITKSPGGGAKSPRIDILFPELDNLRQHSFKIPELVDAISSYYAVAPTLCMAAIRILLESSTKAFFLQVLKEELSDSFESLVNKAINIRNCNVNDPDFIKCGSVNNQAFVSNFKTVSEKYKTLLSKDVKININNNLKELNLNMFIHNPNIIATDVAVYKNMQIFSPLLNYIFDVLLIE